MFKVDRKRRRSASSDLLQFNLDELVDNLQHQGGLDRVAEFIRDMADQGGLSLEDLEEITSEAATSSFSNATWKEVAPKFELDPSMGFDQLRIFSIPIAPLPPSFHREVMRVSAMFLNVYQERGAQEGEAARVRLLDAVRAFLVLS